MKYTISLKKNHVFCRLYRRGENAASPWLVIYCRPNGRRQNRLGITVSTKLGGAVVRNRVRRRLREVYRLHEDNLRPGFDIVLVARSKTVGAPFSKLEGSFLNLSRKLSLLKKEEGE